MLSFRMFEFSDSPVPVSDDVQETFESYWDHLAAPGATLTSAERSAVARSSRGEAAGGAHPALIGLAEHLGTSPGTVFEPEVRAAADVVGDPKTVETIAVVSLLSCVDGVHDALGTEREALPDSRTGEPTGEVAEGYKRRRTHVPMPQGAIPVAMDLIPAEGAERIAMSAPTYMPDDEMGQPDWEKPGGLDRSQMEVIAARTSWHNDCFY